MKITNVEWNEGAPAKLEPGMLGKMMEVIADLQHGGVVLEPEDGA